jgi:hypothetical protein
LLLWVEEFSTMRHTLPLCLLAGAASLPPAIVRGASTSVFIATSRYQLGAPFDVRVDFDGRDPVGEARLAAIVRDFIGSYPTKRDYWEIANRALARRLRDVFPAGTAFSSTFSIDPDAVYPARRASRVDVDSVGSRTEWFEFEVPAPISKRLHGLRVAYQYRPDCPPEAIPDYRYVQQELLVFGAAHDLGSPSSRLLAAAFLLARFPTLPRLSVSLDREAAAWLGATQRQPGVSSLETDGDCRLQPRYPGEELVFAPAEFCSGLHMPGRRNRRYVTPPLATGAGGAAYEAELRCVEQGLAAGIVLPAEFSARAGRHGLVGGDCMATLWRCDFVTNCEARRETVEPETCGVPAGWFPTCRSAELLGLGLPEAPLAAVVPVWLGDRLAGMDSGIRRTPETLERQLVLFQRVAP